MSKSRWLIYILIFLFSFAEYLPVPYAPEFLHTFYSGGGSAAFLIVFLGLLLWAIVTAIWSYFNPRKKFLMFEAAALSALFLATIMSVPMLDEWRNRATIRLNENRDVNDFVNPFLGMKMVDCRKVSRPYEVIFKHNGASIEFDMLEYSPNRPIPQLHLDGSRMLYGDGITKVYKENWYLSGSGSQYSLDWANCLTDERQ